MPTDATDELICNGLICWYDSCSNIAQPYKRQKIPILGRGECTAIVIEQKCCLSYNDPPFPFGVIKDDDFTCKLGLGLSTTGLKKKHDMKNLFSYVCEVLPYKQVGQIPFGDKGALPPRHPRAQSHRPSVTQFILSDCCTRPPCVRSPPAGVSLLLPFLLSETGLRG